MRCSDVPHETRHSADCQVIRVKHFSIEDTWCYALLDREKLKDLTQGSDEASNGSVSEFEGSLGGEEHAVTLAPQVRLMIDETPPGMPDHLDPTDRREYARLLSDVLFLRYGRPGPAVHAIDERAVPVRGDVISVRIYRPSPDPNLPAHLTFHGGGWQYGSINERVSDAICRQRCAEARCVIISVEYRLAPEYRFPVPLDDCYMALLWATENAELLGIDAENLSVGGSSAGANLAAAVALRARNEGGPRLRFQLLEVPALDLTRATARSTWASGVIPNVPQPTMVDATVGYLNHPGEAHNALASPLLADDLRELPSAHVMTAEFDVLRTEGERYAERLRAAGVAATHHRYPGALHGTAMLTRTWTGARDWQQDAATALAGAHWPVPDSDTTSNTSGDRGVAAR